MISIFLWCGTVESSESLAEGHANMSYAQYTPPTPTRQNSFVTSASVVCIGHKTRFEDVIYKCFLACCS